MTISSCCHDDSHFDYAIVEGECFEASTALALKREWSNARIIWFENSVIHTVSKDVNKIIRIVYSNKDYIAFAEQTMRMWKKEASYCNFYHRTLWIQVISEDSYRSKMKTSKNRMISTQELLQMMKSHDESKLNSEEKLWLNENIDYVDSTLTIEAIAEEASRLSVIRQTKDVTRLIINEEVCLEIEADQYRVIAEKIIIVVDPWTSKLLKSSKVEFSIDFFTVVDVEVATMSFHNTEFSELKFMPILVTKNDMSYFIFKLYCNSLNIQEKSYHQRSIRIWKWLQLIPFELIISMSRMSIPDSQTLSWIVSC